MHTHTPVCLGTTPLWKCGCVDGDIIAVHMCWCHKHAFVLTCVRVVVSWHHMCVCNTITIRRVHTRGCLCIIQYLATVSHSLSLWSPASPVLLSVNWKPNGLFDPIRAHAKSTLPSLEPARATHTAWQHPPPFCPAESRQAGITLFIDRRCEILLIDYLWSITGRIVRGENLAMTWRFSTSLRVIPLVTVRPQRLFITALHTGLLSITMVENAFLC